MANVISSVAAPASLEWDIIIKPLLDDPQIQALPFDFIFGPFLNRDLYFNTQLDKISVKKVACGWTFNGGAEVTKKTLVPIEIAAAVEQCYIPLVNTVFAFGLPDGWERGTLSPEVVNFILEQRAYAFNRDLLSIFLLGDTGLASTYYNMMDGFYTKLAAGVVAGDGTVDAGAVVAADLAPGTFLATMMDIYDSQTRFLKGIPKTAKKWIWTDAVYELYTRYLQSTSQDTAGLIQRSAVENGLEPTKFNGVDIVVVPIVDERIEADFSPGSPAVAENPYRIVLTDPTNHKVLMDGAGMIATEPWYEKKDDKYYATGSALLAYEYGYGESNVIAGF